MRPEIAILLIIVVALVGLGLAGRRRWAFTAGGLLLAAFFIARAVVEPFVIDMSDPATYEKDWGGPHLLGVLAVHCGPGLIAAVLVGVWLRRRIIASRAKASAAG